MWQNQKYRLLLQTWLEHIFHSATPLPTLQFGGLFSYFDMSQ